MRVNYSNDDLGTHFGYPQCCINSFWKTRGALGNKKGAEAGNYTGFIPCPQCAERVLSGEVRLEELIVNREHPHPFPQQKREDMPKSFNTWLNK